MSEIDDLKKRIEDLEKEVEYLESEIRATELEKKELIEKINSMRDMAYDIYKN